eukprot:404356_1
MSNSVRSKNKNKRLKPGIRMKQILRDQEFLRNNPIENMRINPKKSKNKRNRSQPSSPINKTNIKSLTSQKIKSPPKKKQKTNVKSLSLKNTKSPRKKKSDKEEACDDDDDDDDIMTVNTMGKPSERSRSHSPNAINIHFPPRSQSHSPSIKPKLKPIPHSIVNRNATNDMTQNFIESLIDCDDNKSMCSIDNHNTCESQDEINIIPSESEKFHTSKSPTNNKTKKKTEDTNIGNWITPNTASDNQRKLV